MAEAVVITYEVTLPTTVEILVRDPDVIERVTGPNGDEWWALLYDLRTLRDVLNHLAYNCIANEQRNARLLDGWADLPEDAVSMRVVRVEEEG